MSSEIPPSPAPFEENIPRKAKLAYAGANTTNGLLSSLMFTPITFFYNLKLGLLSEYIQLGWLIFAIWNAINDPIFGFIEDRTKSKLGRHIPYVRYGSVIYGVLFILTWYPIAPLDDQLALFFNFLLTLAAFDTMYTIIGLVTYVLPAEMAVTSKARANLVVYSTVFGAFGTIISNLLPVFLLTGDESRSLNPLFRPIMILIAILSSAIMYISTYYLEEKHYTMSEPQPGILESIKLTFRNHHFIIFEGSKFMIVLFTNILTTGVLYYIQFVLDLGGSTIAKLLPVVAVFGTATLCVLFFQTKVDKWGLRKLAIFGNFWCGGMFLVSYLLARQLETAVIGFVLIGIGLSAILITNGTMIADCIDYDEVQSGKRRETTYAGIEALITKPAISLGNWMFLVIIEAYGYDLNLSIQSPDAQTGILVAMFLVPAIIFMISGLIIRYYTLDGPEWKSQKEQLARIHETKEKEFLAKLQNQN